MIHPSTATFSDLGSAIAYANDFLADTNAAEFSGIPATGYEIFETTGIYGTTYEVAFTAAFAVVAGAQFAA